MQTTSPMRVVVLMPLRDDWTCAAELIGRLDRVFSSAPCTLEVMLVDDGSIQAWDAADFRLPLTAVRAVRILRLRRNLGHQRAIAIGLAHIEKSASYDAVLVMDADGEDTPDGALALVQALVDDGGSRAIFAERTRRSESIGFRVSYWLYRLLHRAATGVNVRVGNFSIVPAGYLASFVVLSELWNHYAAAVFRSGLSYRTIPIPRGVRIAGTSRMNYVALVTHGLSAISVFGDVVAVRLLIASLIGSLLALLGIFSVVTVRLLTDQAIPGWATYASGTLAVIFIQFITIAMSFTFYVLAARTNLGFLPSRDYAYFVAEVVEIHRHE